MHHRNPIIGALILSTFITACLAWLFYGAGAPLPIWGYPLVFGVFLAWSYVVGRMLIDTTRPTIHVRSFDVSIEGT